VAKAKANVKARATAKAAAMAIGGGKTQRNPPLKCTYIKKNIRENQSELPLEAKIYCESGLF
jgi:hypothetical protein